MGALLARGYCSCRIQTEHSLVVAMDGSLCKFNMPVLAAQVLSQPQYQGCFICSSDSLYMGEYVQPLSPNDELEPGQLYFLLPTKKLRYAISSSDMAQLLRLANTAICRNNNGRLPKWKISKNKACDCSSPSSSSSFSSSSMVGRYSVTPPHPPMYPSPSPSKSTRRKLETIHEV